MKFGQLDNIGREPIQSIAKFFEASADDIDFCNLRMLSTV
jgi:hypothetical protein